MGKCASTGFGTRNRLVVMGFWLKSMNRNSVNRSTAEDAKYVESGF